MRFLPVFVALFALTTAPVFAQEFDEDTSAKHLGGPAGLEAKPAPSVVSVVKGGSGKVSSLITSAPLKGDYVLGNRKAPLFIVEYASMSCPHCAHFANTVLPELQKKYIDTGKVGYILRQFPLNEPALKAEMLLDCVGKQDEKKYYTFAAVLFSSQEKWAFDENFLANLQTIAGVGGLSKEQFGACVNNTERETRLLKAKKLANDELKVPHTPYIFIGDYDYEGPRTLEDMSAVIDAKLAGKPVPVTAQQ